MSDGTAASMQCCRPGMRAPMAVVSSTKRIMKQFEVEQRVTTIDHLFEGDHAIPMETVGVVVAVETKGVRVRFSSHPQSVVLVHEHNLEFLSTKTAASASDWLPPEVSTAEAASAPIQSVDDAPGLAFPSLGRRSARSC